MATAPLENAIVTVFRWESDTETYTNIKNTTTDEFGEYSLSGLWLNRSYKIKFQDADGDYLTIYYGSSGMQADLETGSAVYMSGDWENINATMSKGGSISGTVEGEV